MSCYLLERGAGVDCDDLPIGGTEARIILINYDDVNYIRTLNGRITEIALNPGKVGYEFFGFRQDVRKGEDVVETNLKNRFRHLAEFVIYDITQIQKNNIRKLAKGRFMAIVENRGKDEDSFELLGRECGLKLTSGMLRENGNEFKISLSTPDNGVEYERKLPQSFEGTYTEISDYIDTLLDSSPWILADGTWNDSGIWIDTEVWID